MKTSRIVCFWLALLHSMSYFFFLNRSHSLSWRKIFDAILSKIDLVLSINLSADVFALGDFNVYHKGWLTYYSGTDSLGEFCYISISNDLTQMINFPSLLHVCHSHSPSLLDLFLFSDASSCSKLAFSPLENSDHVVASVSTDFFSDSKRDDLFTLQLRNILVWILMVFVIIGEMFHNFCLAALITLVLLMWKWIDFFLKKNHLLRYGDCSFF